MMRAHSRAWAVLKMPGKCRRTSTAAANSPRPVDGTDRSSLGVGDAEHVEEHGKVAQA